LSKREKLVQDAVEGGKFRQIQFQDEAVLAGECDDTRQLQEAAVPVPIAHVNYEQLLTDQLNIKILRLLQEDPRMSISQLARQIKMSNPAAKERVVRLEESGIISGYRLELDPRNSAFW